MLMSTTYHPPQSVPGRPGYRFATVFANFAGAGATKDLANHLQSVYEDLDATGATGAASRLAELDKYADSARKSYDPTAVLLRASLDETRTELDDIVGAGARSLSAWRNAFALTPLLLTWLTLGIATLYYYFYYIGHDHAGRNDVVVQPFIVAWESGFDHHLFFTFAQVAVTDFVLLLIVLALTIFMHSAENKAIERANALFQSVTTVVSELVDALYDQKIRSDLRASPEQWAQRAEEVITRAMTSVDKTISTAQKAIHDAADVIGGFEKRTDAFFTRIDTSIGTLIQDTGNTLTTTVQDLRRELGNYSNQTTKLLESVTKVQQAADTLRTNVEEYTRLARSIDGHVAGLEVSQGALVGQMSAAAGSIGKVADSFTSDTLGALATQVSEAANALQNAVINQTTIPDEYMAAAKSLHATADELADKVARNTTIYSSGPGAGSGPSTPAGAYGPSPYGPGASGSGAYGPGPYGTAAYRDPPPSPSGWFARVRDWWWTRGP